MERRNSIQLQKRNWRLWGLEREEIRVMRGFGLDAQTTKKLVEIYFDTLYGKMGNGRNRIAKVLAGTTIETHYDEVYKAIEKLKRSVKSRTVIRTKAKRRGSVILDRCRERVKNGLPAREFTGEKVDNIAITRLIRRVFTRKELDRYIKEGNVFTRQDANLIGRYLTKERKINWIHKFVGKHFPDGMGVEEAQVTSHLFLNSSEVGKHLTPGELAEALVKKKTEDFEHIEPSNRYKIVISRRNMLKNSFRNSQRG